MEERMTSPATVEIQVDLPAGIRVCEYERIDQGHAFHVEWDLPLAGTDRKNSASFEREDGATRPVSCLALGPARTPNGLDTRSFCAVNNKRF